MKKENIKEIKKILDQFEKNKDAKIKSVEIEGMVPEKKADEFMKNLMSKLKKGK